jgi:hypothetical protein
MTGGCTVLYRVSVICLACQGEKKHLKKLLIAVLLFLTGGRGVAMSVISLKLCPCFCDLSCLSGGEEASEEAANCCVIVLDRGAGCGNVCNIPEVVPVFL